MSKTGEKDRFLRTLSAGGGHTAERPPVIVPGSFRAGPGVDLAKEEDLPANPQFFKDARRLSELSLFIHDRTGIENLGLPFAMRVISEAYGGEIDEWRGGPRIPPYPLKEVGEWKKLKNLNPAKDGLLPVIVECMGLLSQTKPDIPVIADITAPLSLATALIDAKTLLKAFLRETAEAHAFLSFLSLTAVEYARSLVDAGATAVFIDDPFSTVALLGRDFFSLFAVPYINRITDAVHGMGCPVMVHLCGPLMGVRKELEGLRAECISVDSCVSLKGLMAALPGHLLMGNVSSLILDGGREDEIRAETRRALKESPHIVAPSCGLTKGVTLKSLNIMASEAK
ncbi:MAG: hypothetical protein HY883_07970 [Deltaproteobacteria bacterium]|nr:hypothetical protein [Deltaproteobacteria bacterium]